MNGAKFRRIGMTLLAGASFAVACGGDDGDDDDGGASGSPTSTSTTAPTTTSQTQTATSQGTSSTTANTSLSTSTTGSSTTGSGGSAGGGGSAGACNEDPLEPPVVDGAAGEGGGGGQGGASSSPIELVGEGWNFTSPDELDDWAVEECDTCTEDAQLAWSCGVMEAEVNWTADANSASQHLRLVNYVPETALRDLAGRTLVLQVRMTSDWVEDNGYDVNIAVQDHGDGSDWDWFATCWNGEGDCLETPGGELFSPDDGWTTAFLTMDAAPDEVATDGIIKLIIEIGTKHYDGPTFTYDAAPVNVEVNALVW